MNELDLDKLEKLVDAIKKMLPVVEAAYWDDWSAGNFPGSGYYHKCYRKLPFTWRQEDAFNEWVVEIKEILKELEGE